MPTGCQTENDTWKNGIQWLKGTGIGAKENTVTTTPPDSTPYDRARGNAERVLELASSRQHEELVQFLAEIVPIQWWDLHIYLRPPTAPHLTIIGDYVAIWTPTRGTRTATVDEVATVLLVASR